MRVEHEPQPAEGRSAPAVSPDACRASTLAAADDATLSAAIAALDVEAVEVVYHRHASALCSLALLIVEDSKIAENAVAGAFIALWRNPTSIDLEKQSLCAALAGEVYTLCTQARETHHAREPPAKSRRRPRPPIGANLALLPYSQRDLLALILLGEHSHRQAARRVGLSEVTAAKAITEALCALRAIPPRLVRSGRITPATLIY